MLLRSKALLFTAIFIVLTNEVKSCTVPEIRDKKDNEKKIVDIIAGKVARLTCRVKNSGTTTSWLKNNRAISPSDHPRMRIKLNKYLKIKRVEKDDAGFYTCVAENDCGRNTFTVELLVGTAPKFTVPSDRLSRSLLALPVGNSVKLDCSAEGHPRPTVTWYKDGARFLERKGGSKLYLGRWTLLLNMKDLVPTDSGKYTCNVSNAYGWINHTYVVDVHEQVRAKPVVLPMENVTVYEGENATLLCKALRDSMLHFQWLRWYLSTSNGTANSTIEHPYYEFIKQNEQDPNRHLIFHNKSHFYGEKLTLVNVTKKDEGKYTCIVGNAVGYSVEQAYIIIKEHTETTSSPQVITDNASRNITQPPKTLGVSALPAPKKTIYVALLAATAVVVVLILGVVMFYCRRKLKFAKGAGYDVVSKPHEPTVQYKTHAPSIGSSL